MTQVPEPNAWLPLSERACSPGRLKFNLQHDMIVLCLGVIWPEWMTGQEKT